MPYSQHCFPLLVLIQDLEVIQLKLVKQSTLPRVHEDWMLSGPSERVNSSGMLWISTVHMVTKEFWVKLKLSNLELYKEKSISLDCSKLQFKVLDNEKLLVFMSWQLQQRLVRLLIY